jgi:hypothetical protein
VLPRIKKVFSRSTLIAQEDLGNLQNEEKDATLNILATSDAGPRRGPVTQVANHVRNKKMPIQAAQKRKSQSRCNVAKPNFFLTFNTDPSRKAFC